MSAGVPKPANPSAHVDPKSAPLKEIPDVLVDPRTMRRYTRGRFLGKGGFAKCYEITDVETKQVFAGKIVPKSLILKQHQREKMTSEIAIHKSLNHANIVGFHGFFEDDDFVFVVLEICRRRVSENRKWMLSVQCTHFSGQTVIAAVSSVVPVEVAQAVKSIWTWSRLGYISMWNIKPVTMKNVLINCEKLT